MFDLKKKFIFAAPSDENNGPVYTGKPERKSSGPKGFKRNFTNNVADKDKPKKKKKFGAKLIIWLLILIALIFYLKETLYVINEGEMAYVTEFGKAVEVVEEPGLHRKKHIYHNVQRFSSKIMLYDVSTSEVLTSDKKAMVVDSYALWKIDDLNLFFRSIGNMLEVENRIDAAVFSVMRNIMGKLEQSEIVTDNRESRESLNDKLTEAVQASMSGYGVDIIRVEIRRYDLPPENLNAVYTRMISERHRIAEAVKAEGEYEARKIRNDSDKKARILLGKAKSDAEKIRGEAEEEYMNILAELYGDKEKAEFYKFCIRLDAIKDGLQGDKVLIAGPESPLYKIVNGEAVNDYYQKEKADD